MNRYSRRLSALVVVAYVGFVLLGCSAPVRAQVQKTPSVPLPRQIPSPEQLDDLARQSHSIQIRYWARYWWRRPIHSSLLRLNSDCGVIAH